MNEAESPVPEYSCLADVINETRDVYVVDLVRFTSRLGPTFTDCLKPAPMGVYTRGALEPIIVFDVDRYYYTATQFQTDRQKPDIYCFNDFINSREPVVDQRGRIICVSPHQLRHYFQEECSFNYTAIHMAAIAVWNILRSLHRDVRPSSRLPRHWLDEHCWLKPEMISTYYDDVGLRNMEDLIEQVYTFIGRDYCATYSMDLQNTTLHVGKGNDFRVIEYYRRIFEAHEAERFEKFGY